MPYLEKIISGGQTGVDRAALDAAIELDIAHGGWCPKGRRAEDGPIAPCYSLTETESPDYRQRTRLNVEDSDATLIIFSNELEGGTKYTYDIARKIKKPVLLVDAEIPIDETEILSWFSINDIHTLNIAGPRASKKPDIYRQAKQIIKDVLSRTD